MKSALCDINFFLDIFLKREPFYFPAAWIFKMIEEKKLKGYICALSFPTLYYLLSKELKREKSIKILEKVRIVFHVAGVDERVIDLSLTSNFRDFEDAVQYYSAVQVRADCLITRNKGDYKVDNLPILTSEEFMAILKSQNGGTT